jgi:hypothetical protein
MERANGAVESLFWANENVYELLIKRKEDNFMEGFI